MILYIHKITQDTWSMILWYMINDHTRYMMINDHLLMIYDLLVIITSCDDRLWWSMITQDTSTLCRQPQDDHWSSCDDIYIDDHWSSCDDILWWSMSSCDDHILWWSMITQDTSCDTWSMILWKKYSIFTRSHKIM